MLILVLIVLVWSACGYFLYIEGNKREVGGTMAFLLSVLFTPLVGFIIVALSRPLQPQIITEAKPVNSDLLNSLIADELVKLNQSYEKEEIDYLQFISRKSELLNKRS
jgi:hypothetical protein